MTLMFIQFSLMIASCFITAPVFRRPSVLPAIHHQYLQTQCGIGYQRDELFSTAAATLDSDEGNETEQKITVTFVDKDGEETNIKVPVGMSMLEAAHENDLDLEGACEASLACSTCHVIVMDMSQYNKIPDPTDEENDMLDLAFGLTET
ncbi:adrenodoxin-like protein 1, mitochondrial isoform X2 [Primulina huaijiensis]